MNRPRCVRVPLGRALLAAGLCATLAATVRAQSPQPAGVAFPAKPVRILVGFAPGGGIDVSARLAAQRLGESLGQPFLVDNRAGASGAIAAAQVAKAAPDGHILLMTADVHVITPAFARELPYDPIKDFAAVGTLVSGPQAIAVHPSLPARSAAELIALARTQREGIAYASAGGGTLTHVAMELFRSMAGIRLLHVPYKGSGASVVAVIGGEVPILSIAIGQSLPHSKAGKLRTLAVTSAKRSQLAPEIPALAETPGLAGYEASSWVGMLAPAATPAAIVNTLNAEIERLLQRRDVLEQLAARAWVAHARSPKAFSEFIAAETAKWAKLIRDADLKAQ
ncbi:MAG: tripartite tricarboxylate transporter substrate binding protein [Burkholderiales bacterium]|nr:tripartite tricarboxylate transporter substrate binding protein [Burkholderiales bacterium]